MTDHIAALEADPDVWTTVQLDRPGRYTTPKVVDQPAVTLSRHPGTVRQLIVKGLDRDTPTVVITNSDQARANHVIERYARRMTIEQRRAEAIRAFHIDALASAVALNVDLDVLVRLNRRAYSPVLRAADLPATPIPWWGGRTLHYEFA